MSRMLDPGTHEDDAQARVGDRDTDAAQVSALLAVAAAINRLADVMDNKD